MSKLGKHPAMNIGFGEGEDVNYVVSLNATMFLTVIHEIPAHFS